MTFEKMSFKQRSVKEIFIEMKDLAELLIDLSYSSILYNNATIAEQVLHLEEKMDRLQMHARMSILLSARNRDEAEQLAPLLGIIGATEDISNAAGDIAKIVTEDMNVPAELRAALPDAFETVVQAEVSNKSSCAGKKIRDTVSVSKSGVKILTIHRKGDWLINPGPDTVLKADDILIMRGHEKELFDTYQTVTGGQYSPEETKKTRIKDVKKAVTTIIEMKNFSEVAVDLAYSSVLSNSKEIAQEVSELEIAMDRLQSAIETWVLQAAPKLKHPLDLRGLIRLAVAAENISDAAFEISSGVLRGLPIHPVFMEAVKESEETLKRFEVMEESRIAGKTLGDETVKGETGVTVVGIRRNTDGEAHWRLSPDAETVIKTGDVLIAKGPHSAMERFQELTG